jgi:hypothetical protein
MKKTIFVLMLLCMVASFTDTLARDRHWICYLDRWYPSYYYRDAHGYKYSRYYDYYYDYYYSYKYQKALNEIELLKQKKAESDIARRRMSRVKVLNARFYKQYTTDTLPISMAEITIENKSDYSIKRILFNGKLVTHKTGQVLINDTFRCDIDGAFASGETNTYDMPLNSYGGWAKMRPPDLARFDVVVVGIETSDGTVFVDSFSEKDQKKLDGLKKWTKI